MAAPIIAEPAADQVKKNIKRRIILWILAIILPIVGWLLLVVSIILITMIITCQIPGLKSVLGFCQTTDTQTADTTTATKKP